MKGSYKLNIGDRVITVNNEIGYIEDIDSGNFCEVRLLTPKNIPSCVVTFCAMRNLKKVPESVVPMPASKEWYREAIIFCNVIKNAIYNSDITR